MKDKTNATPANATVTLEEPIKREGGDVTTLTIRKPASGELRGLSLVELLNLDVTALHKLLPRLTLPAITEHEARQLSVADLVQCGTEIVSFLVPKSQQEAIQPA